MSKSSTPRSARSKQLTRHADSNLLSELTVCLAKCLHDK